MTKYISKVIIFVLSLLMIGFILPLNQLSAEEAPDVTSTTINELGFSITTPNELLSVDKKQDTFFYATSKDGNYYIEVYDSENYLPKSNFEGVTNLSDASEEQKNKFFEAVKNMVANSQAPSNMKTEPMSEFVTINDVVYVKSQLSFLAGKDMIIWSGYFTVADGKCIDFQSTFVGGTENDIDRLNTEFDKIMQTVLWGDDAKSAAAASIQAVDTQGNSTGIWDKINNIELPFWIFLILLAGILIWKIKFAKIKEWHEDALSLDVSKGILGFFAILIILHHLVQALGAEKAGSLGFLENLGVCFVGAFFFFSGYGLYSSFKSKAGYLNGFIKKRMPSILIPFYVCILVFVLTGLAAGETYSGKDLAGYLTGFILLNTQMWYVVEIAIFYIIFYLVFRFIKNENAALTVFGVITVVFIGISLLLGHGRFWFQGEWWYNSSLLLFVGVIISRYKEKITTFVKKAYWVVLPICIIATGIFYKASIYMIRTYSYWSETSDNGGYADKLRCLSCQLPMIIFFVLSLLLISMKIQFKNPILNFLGKISLELYLIHNLFIINFRSDSMFYIESNFIYVIFVIIFAIFLAWLLHGFDQYLIKSISGMKNKESITKDKTERNHSIDCFRIIACFLVVCIHLPFKGAMGDIFIAFGKTAVPFFLVVCGYLIYREDTSEILARLKKQIKRIFILTILSNILFVVVAYINSCIAGTNQNFLERYFTLKNFKNFLLYNLSPFAEHLWYLGSLLYALIILFLLVKFKLHKYIMYLAPVLLGIYIFLSWKGNAEYYVYRNAILVTLPYLMMGFLVRRYEKKLLNVKGYVYIILVVILSITNVLEYSIYKTISVPFFSAELLVYVIVILLLKYPNIGKGTIMERAGNKYSLFIYIAHMIPVFYIYSILNSANGLIRNFGPIIVFALTFAAAAVLKSIKLPNNKSKCMV